MSHFIGVVGATWVWSSLLVAAPYFWLKRTNRSQSPVERRIRAIGLGFGWPYFVVKYFMAQSGGQNRAVPDGPGGGGSGSAGGRAAPSPNAATPQAPPSPRTPSDSPSRAGSHLAAAAGAPASSSFDGIPVAASARRQGDAAPAPVAQVTARPLPAQYGQGVEAYGEHLLSHANGQGFDIERLGDTLQILDAARSDRAGFVASVEQAIQGRSGAAAVGAVEQITHVHGIKIEDTAAGLRILDLSLDCLNARLVPWERLKEFQQNRWLATHGAGTW